MPTVEFFEKFGLIAFRNFLDRDLCDELCNEITTAEKVGASVRLLQTSEKVTDGKYSKRKQTSELNTHSSTIVEEKLKGILSSLTEEKKLNLVDIQPPKYCLYETGDFFAHHVDTHDDKNANDISKFRKLSGIIFLNEESQEPEEGKYCGGNLTFYGLNKNESFAKFGLPLVGEQGMLITFPPTLPHEVTPVTSGERFTIATWFI